MLQNFLGGPVKRGLITLPIFINKVPILFGFKLIFIMPVIGIINLPASRKIDRLLWPLIALTLYGVVLAFFESSFVSMIRLTQLFGMVCFGHYLSEHLESEDFIKLEKSLLVLAAIYIAGEIAMKDFIPDKEFLPGLHIPRLLGIVGESNYSGILCAIVTASIWLKRKSWWCSLGVLTVLMTSSRVAVIVLVLAAGWDVIAKLPPKKLKFFCRLAILSLLAYPLILWSLERSLSVESQAIVNRIYSGRFTIHLSYISMFFDHPFGVGFFQGPELFHSYAALGSKLMQSGYTYPIDHIPVYQQHGMFIHILTEFGILGYILFGYLIWTTMSRSLEKSHAAAYLFFCALSGFLTLNVLTDFAFIFSLTRFSLNANKY